LRHWLRVIIDRNLIPEVSFVISYQKHSIIARWRWRQNSRWLGSNGLVQVQKITQFIEILWNASKSEMESNLDYFFESIAPPGDVWLGTDWNLYFCLFPIVVMRKNHMMCWPYFWTRTVHFGRYTEIHEWFGNIWKQNYISELFNKKRKLTVI